MEQRARHRCGLWTISNSSEMKNSEKIKCASKYILNNTLYNGNTAIILGSGLGSFSKTLKESIQIAYKEIPYFTESMVKGHNGKLIVGKLFNKQILIASGRLHFYEGHSKEKVVFIVQVMNACGIKNLIITNSSGSLDKKNPPGTIMIVKGHLDCTFQDNSNFPLLNEDIKYHSKSLINICQTVSLESKVKIISGNYCWVLGPLYETPEEIKFFQQLNGTAVGMSTLPEIREAGELGLRVLTIALLTNYAAGITDEKLSHKEVLIIADRSKNKFSKFLLGILKRV